MHYHKHQSPAAAITESNKPSAQISVLAAMQENAHVFWYSLEGTPLSIYQYRNHATIC